MEPQVGTVRRVGFVGRAAVVLLGLAVVAVGVLAVRRLTVKHPACGPPVPNRDSTYVAADSLGKGKMLADALARWYVPRARINEALCKGCGNRQAPGPKSEIRNRKAQWRTS
jgi:hypothetical protein